MQTDDVAPFTPTVESQSWNIRNNATPTHTDVIQLLCSHANNDVLVFFLTVSITRNNNNNDETVQKLENCLVAHIVHLHG